MTADLLALATATSGGRELWDTLSGLRIDISITLMGGDMPPQVGTETAKRGAT
jgi:hypothetical protein